MSPKLKAEGYCVFALDYGVSDSVAADTGLFKATGDIALSAKELAVFVDQVLAAPGVLASGAQKVDIVGHSQGGMMPRQYLKFEGGAAKVQNLVGIAPSSHGLTGLGLASLAKAIGLTGLYPPTIGQAWEQQTAGSQFLQQLNAGGDTVPGVNYTAIATRYDEIVTPYRSQFLTAGPGASVQNIVLQDGCLLDFSDHVSIVNDFRALHYVLNALDPARAATPQGRYAPCLPVAPLI